LAPLIAKRLKWPDSKLAEKYPERRSLRSQSGQWGQGYLKGSRNLRGANQSASECDCVLKYFTFRKFRQFPCFLLSTVKQCRLTTFFHGTFAQLGDPAPSKVGLTGRASIGVGFYNFSQIVMMICHCCSIGNVSCIGM